MTPRQVEFVKRLLFKEGISFLENEYALKFSNGRTSVLEELTHTETQNLIAEFKEASPKEKMQGKILSMAHEMRWELPNGKVDMERLNKWCVKSTKAHKPFNQIPEEDLSKVVSVFEKMYKSFLKSL